MSERTFRIKIRGTFDRLSPEQRAELLARAAEHDVLNAAFTPAGSLTYDLAARPFFTFRFAESGERAEDADPATERALAATRAWMDERGYGYKDLKPTVEDLAEAPLSKRQRRDLAANS